MNHKSTLFFLLFLTLIFGLFSGQSDIYAQETTTPAETSLEVRKEKADSKNSSQEATKASQEESLAKNQMPPKADEETISVEDQTLKEVTEDTTNSQNSKDASFEEDQKSQDSSENNQETASEEAVSKPEIQDPAKDEGKLEALEEKNPGPSEETENPEKMDPALEAQENEAPKALAGEAEKSKNLYLDGQDGDDENDGLSREKALKTFEKAKEKAEENSGIENIYVTGTTPVEGEVSLDKTKTKAKLVRDKSFNGYLLSVESKEGATLKDITVDGNSGENKNIEKSLVYVGSGSTLNIQDGAVLKNNQIKDIKNTATRGGAVHAYHATVNMTGGNIEDNQATYGGGIYLNGSTLNFSGGIVQKNTSNRVEDEAYKQIYSAGGGILAYAGSTVNLSNDATVAENSAAEIGGGISLGSNQAGATNTLNMTGGIIDGNTAGAAGGGLFIQGGLSNGTQSKAYISAGQIINNKMDGSGITDNRFGGGGIYVNGVANPWNYQGNTYYGANGELHLTNVLINDNTSTLQGAGMANCPISKTTIHVNNGVALYGNSSTDTLVHDFYILSHRNYNYHSGKAEYNLSKRMLGGAPFNWTTLDGKPLADAMHKGSLDIPEGKEYNYLALNVNSKGNALTKVLTKVIISGNSSATRGGGIGSNGTIVIGTEGDTTEVSVEKKWDDNNNARNRRPSTIKVQLLAKYENQEYIIETKEMKEEENWKSSFSDLVTTINGKEVAYTIREVPINGYESTVTGNMKDGFIITNKEKPEVPPEEPKNPPEEPKNPPEEPKEPPEEPEIPPETPPEIPEVPPEVPEEPPVIPVVPPKKPSPPRGGAPQTYDPGMGIYLALASMSSFGLYVVRKKKED